MAADASASLASASSPPSATAWVTQCPRCSSSSPSATDCNALGALVAVGVVTATLPARRAAQLPPTEALRYEA